MKLRKIISVLLILAMCVGILAACNDGSSSDDPTPDRVGDSWEGINFGGQKVGLCISNNKYEECNFPAADIYTKGPDNAGSNEVAKEVLSRNKQASETLGITIDYTMRDLTYKYVIDDIKAIVLTSSKNSPDIYNNDLYGLARAMCNGYLWNVKDPGENVKNYFDFDAEGWYTEYIRGCTFDQNKFYLFAGDYFIDMIRMAWVVYVNNDIFMNNIGKMPGWCTSVDLFYDFVADGFWDMDLLSDIASRVYVDSGRIGTPEKTDTLLGLVYNEVSGWILSAASGVTLFYQDEEHGYAPKMMEGIDEYQRVSNKYTDMISESSAYSTSDGNGNNVLASTTCFLNGNVLFAFSRLGEMESEALRNFSDSKGLVPVPKWYESEQEDYFTPVHDQAEIGCILNTAKTFSAASALMQYLNENSKQVVYTYYEKGLKYKYNDDKNAREMMDIVRNTTDSPFSWQIGSICLELYTGTPALTKLYLKNNTTVASTFASEKDVYADCLKQMIEKFAKLD